MIVNNINRDHAVEVATRLQGPWAGALAIQEDVSKREEVEPMFDPPGSRSGRSIFLSTTPGWKPSFRFSISSSNGRGSSTSTCAGPGSLRRSSVVRQSPRSGSIPAGKVLPGRAHYAPAKLSLEALNRSAEVTQQGIRVNCIHPGLTDTPMTDWIMKEDEVKPLILAQLSLGRAAGG